MIVVRILKYRNEELIVELHESGDWGWVRPNCYEGTQWDAFRWETTRHRSRWREFWMTHHGSVAAALSRARDVIDRRIMEREMIRAVADDVNQQIEHHVAFDAAVAEVEQLCATS
jgi:hypothetical protein